MFSKGDTSGLHSLVEYPEFAWVQLMDGMIRDELIICKIKGPLKVLPQLYTTPYYCLEFLVRGSIRMEINRRRMDIRGGNGIFIFTDYSFRVLESAEDVELFILALSPQLVEELGFLSYANVARIYIHPVLELPEKTMQAVLHYFDLLHDLVPGHSREAVLHLVRSLFLFLDVASSDELPDRSKLSRPEDLTGRFLALVDMHCRDHHSIEWYASELCLTPKYISHVVKQTLGISPGRCIGEAIIRQAKSLLLSTRESIQEISDRLGFQNQSHFGTFFRRYAGMSPGSFRKQDKQKWNLVSPTRNDIGL